MAFWSLLHCSIHLVVKPFMKLLKRKNFYLEFTRASVLGVNSFLHELKNENTTNFFILGRRAGKTVGILSICIFPNVPNECQTERDDDTISLFHFSKHYRVNLTFRSLMRFQAGQKIRHFVLFRNKVFFSILDFIFNFALSCYTPLNVSYALIKGLLDENVKVPKWVNGKWL